MQHVFLSKLCKQFRKYFNTYIRSVVENHLQFTTGQVGGESKREPKRSWSGGGKVITLKAWRFLAISIDFEAL